jgi:hypothetical protein
MRGRGSRGVPVVHGDIVAGILRAFQLCH